MTIQLYIFLFHAFVFLIVLYREFCGELQYLKMLNDAKSSFRIIVICSFVYAFTLMQIRDLMQIYVSSIDGAKVLCLYVLLFWVYRVFKVYNLK